MPECKFCGERIHWHKGIPYSGNGDHREWCTGMLPESREKAKTKNHEERVREFLRKNKK